MRLIIVPGYQGSPEGHWQKWLADEVPGSVLVEQDSWSFPDRDQWVKRLREVVEQFAHEEVCLVAHSVGVLTAVHLLASAREYPQIACALFVAPADSEKDVFPMAITGFSPMPTASLSLPTWVIGSENDPYITEERTRSFAQLWRSCYINYGKVGHINSEAGFGAWPDLLEIIKTIQNRTT